VELPRRRQICRGEGQRAFGIVEFREWADEYRFRSTVEGAKAKPPAPNVGRRETDALTIRAATKLLESGRYVQTTGGYSTFLTLTFDAYARYKINAGPEICGGLYCDYPPQRDFYGNPRGVVQSSGDRIASTVQREVSRFFDAVTKMRRRGWITDAGERVPGIPEPLQYCWVAEAPICEKTGAPNPHVHVLMNWKVKKEHFQSWAARLEKSIWRQGFAHLEKLRNDLAGTSYLLKAVGYMSKGKKGEQGTIAGNRYAINKAARAPGWVVVHKAELQAFGALVADLGDYISHLYGPLYAKKKQLTEKRERVQALKKRAAESREDKSRKRFASIERRLTDAISQQRKKIDALPVTGNKYTIIARGARPMLNILEWMNAAEAWTTERIEYLPAKPAGESWRGGGSADYWREYRREKIRLRVEARSVAMHFDSIDDDRYFSYKVDEYQQWKAIQEGADDGGIKGWIH
jgi:hypothetical protein